MRIVNTKHLPWFLFVCLATTAACLLYVGNFHPDRLASWVRLPPSLIQTPSEHRSVGGTPLGLAFGAISLAIFIFAVLLGLRKKIPLWRVGTVQRWLRAHIWLTLLTIPLVILHSGFRLGGPMTTLLMAMYTVVMVSGIYGLILQHLIPAWMKERLPAETVFEQIPHIRVQLSAAAEKMRNSFIASPPNETDGGAAALSPGKVIAVGSPAMASTTGHLSTPTARAKTAVGSAVTAEPVTTATAESGDTPAMSATPRRDATASATPSKTAPSVADPAAEAILTKFIEDEILPYLRASNGQKFRLGSARYGEDIFRSLHLHVTPAYHTRVGEIQAWCDERRMLDLQTRLHHWLHGWLFLHVPVSFLLLLMTGLHAFMALFRYG